MESIKKLSFAVSPEMEEQIINLRKKDEYCRLPIAEIIRQLVQSGLDTLNAQKQS